MVISAKERSAKKPAEQGFAEDIPKPIKINGSTHFDFEGKNLTAYGGLLPVATMLEKLKFRQLVEQTLTVKRVTRAMPMYQFVLGMVLALLRWIFSAEPSAISGPRADVDGDLKGAGAAAAVYVLAFLGLAPLHVASSCWKCSDSMRQRVMGSRQCAADFGDSRYRYDRAYGVRQSDGSAQKLQPEEQRARKAFNRF